VGHPHRFKFGAGFSADWLRARGPVRFVGALNFVLNIQRREGSFEFYSGTDSPKVQQSAGQYQSELCSLVRAVQKNLSEFARRMIYPRGFGNGLLF